MNRYEKRLCRKHQVIYSYFKNINLKDIGVFYSVPNEDIREELQEFYCDEENSSYTMVEGVELSQVVKNTNNIKYIDTDDDHIKYVLGLLMDYKKYNHFLMVGYGSNWRGQTGYKFIHYYFDAFYRDYDCDLFYQSSSTNGKVLNLTEHSHDVPMGFTTQIIGLTDKEYERLVNANFDSIMKFAKKFQ